MLVFQPQIFIRDMRGFQALTQTVAKKIPRNPGKQANLIPEAPKRNGGVINRATIDGLKPCGLSGVFGVRSGDGLALRFLRACTVAWITSIARSAAPCATAFPASCEARIRMASSRVMLWLPKSLQ